MVINTQLRARNERTSNEMLAVKGLLASTESLIVGQNNRMALVVLRAAMTVMDNMEFCAGLNEHDIELVEMFLSTLANYPEGLDKDTTESLNSLIGILTKPDPEPWSERDED